MPNNLIIQSTNFVISNLKFCYDTVRNGIDLLIQYLVKPLFKTLCIAGSYYIHPHIFCSIALLSFAFPKGIGKIVKRTDNLAFNLYRNPQTHVCLRIFAVASTLFMIKNNIVDTVNIFTLYTAMRVGLAFANYAQEHKQTHNAY